MFGRPDCEAVRARWEAFWAGQSPRPMIYAVIPRTGVDPVPRPHPYAITFGSIDDAIAQTAAWVASHDFVADALPSYQVSFAADHFAALLGSEIRHHPDSPDTMWLEPFVEDWETDDVRFRPESRWWERTVEAIRAFRRRFDGEVLIYGPNLEGGLDALSAIRGPQQLVMDLVDCPEQVERALAAVNRAVDDVRAALDAELDIARWGSTNRFGMYGRGLLDIPQCDFSCMIGPEMFERFQMPCLRHEIEPLHGSIYHLDGPGALQHLEALCTIERLHMIQWQPGSGNYEKDWTAVYRRIDELGKGQFRWLGGREGMDIIRRAWETYRSRHQFYTLGGVTAAEMDAFLASFE